jgi:hypothetical protein
MNRNTPQGYQRTVEVHRANMLKSLEYRLQVAKAKGDERLVLQLEAEKTYYN